MINSDVGYLKVNRFSSTTYKEFTDAIDKLKTLGMKSIILDLRSNPGGYLSAAINMVDEFPFQVGKPLFILKAMQEKNKPIPLLTMENVKKKKLLF